MQKRGISELFCGVRYAYMATNAEYGVVHCGTQSSRTENKNCTASHGCASFLSEIMFVDVSRNARQNKVKEKVQSTDSEAHIKNNRVYGCWRT